MMICRKFSNKRYNKLKESVFENIYGDWDSDVYIESRNLLFNLITGEADFDDFYDRFDAPGTAKGDKPVAWDPRFIPDMINDVLWDEDVALKEKVKKIKTLYKKCVSLEKDFHKKTTKNKEK
jgi:hypothetical protein